MCHTSDSGSPAKKKREPRRRRISRLHCSLYFLQKAILRPAIRPLLIHAAASRSDSLAMYRSICITDVLRSPCDRQRYVAPFQTRSRTVSCFAAASLARHPLPLRRRAGPLARAHASVRVRAARPLLRLVHEPLLANLHRRLPRLDPPPVHDGIVVGVSGAHDAVRHAGRHHDGRLLRPVGLRRVE